MSENKSRIYKGPKRDEISDVEGSIAMSALHQEKLYKQRFEKYGYGNNNKNVVQGTTARLSAFPYPKDTSAISDVRAFRYGYYERGNRFLKVLVETGKTDAPVLNENLKLIYNEINALYGLKEDEMPFDSLSDTAKLQERLRMIGYVDGLDKEITVDKLDEVIRNNQYYSQGYALGESISEEYNKQSGKKGR